MAKMKVNEIIEGARFLVAFGDELESEAGFDAAVEKLLGKAEDKVGALDYVIGVTSRAYAGLMTRSSENGSAAERSLQRRNFLISRREALILEALDLAKKEDDEESVKRFEELLETDPINHGYQITIPSGAVPGASDYDHRQWAEQVLTATLTATEGTTGRPAKITEAVKAHDEPLLACRVLIRTASDRAAYLKEEAARLATAAKVEEDIAKKVKALAETRLRNLEEPKFTDSIGGWIRITSRTSTIAVHPEWNGKGKMRGPDVEALPDHLVKIKKEAKKKELVKGLKAVQGILDERTALEKKIGEAETDEEREGIKAALAGLADVEPIPGAKLATSECSFIGTSK